MDVPIQNVNTCGLLTMASILFKQTLTGQYKLIDSYCMCNTCSSLLQSNGRKL